MSNFDIPKPTLRASVQVSAGGGRYCWGCEGVHLRDAKCYKMPICTIWERSGVIGLDQSDPRMKKVENPGGWGVIKAERVVYIGIDESYES